MPDSRSAEYDLGVQAALSAGVHGVLQRLTEPSSAIRDSDQRWRAQAMAATALGLAALSGVASMLFAAFVAASPIPALSASGFFCIVYAFARSRFAVFAGILAILGLAIPCFVAAWVQAPEAPEAAKQALLWLGVVAVSGSFVLAAGPSLAVNLGLILLTALLPAFVPAMEHVRAGQPVAYLAVLTALSAVAATVLRRSRKAMWAEVEQRKEIEHRLAKMNPELEHLVQTRTDALAKTNEVLATLVDSLPVAMIMLDLRGVVTLWNLEAERLLGWAGEEVLGHPSPLRVLTPSAPTKPVSLGFEHMELTDVELHTKAGNTIPVVLSTAPVEDTVGAVVGAILVVVDPTEQRRLEQRVRQAQKMEAIGRLAGGVAHDFNNLLTVVHGEVELFESQLVDDDPTREITSETLEAASRAATLTRRLLVHGADRLSERALDLNATIRSMGGVLRALLNPINDLRLDLCEGVSADDAAIRADPSQVEQVVLNWVVNANDAMADGGNVSVKTYLADQSQSDDEVFVGSGDPWPAVCLEVSDEGAGIPAELLETVFEPFFTTKDKEHGTGLGLATVKEVASRPGTQVSVESQADVGTKFRFYWRRHCRSAISPSATASRELPRGHEKVLVVDDTGSIRSLVVAQLRQLGYTVVDAAHGEEALTLFAEHADSVDLVVSDLVMPVMGGIECIGRIRQARPGCPAVLMSGRSDRVGRETADQVESIPVLDKPFTMARLAATVRDAIDKA